MAQEPEPLTPVIVGDSSIINKVVYYGDTLIDLSQDTVAQGDVLSGKTVHLPSGQQVQGSMVNNGSTSATITTKAQQVTIPSGYTSGGTVQIDSTEQGKIIAGNIKKDVTILGTTGTYEGASVSSTTATVTPSVNSQIILPSTYSVDYFDEVDVNAIPYAETDNVAGGKTADIGDNATPVWILNTKYVYYKENSGWSLSWDTVSSSRYNELIATVNACQGLLTIPTGSIVRTIYTNLLFSGYFVRQGAIMSLTPTAAENATSYTVTDDGTVVRVSTTFNLSLDSGGWINQSSAGYFEWYSFIYVVYN